MMEVAGSRCGSGYGSFLGHEKVWVKLMCASNTTLVLLYSSPEACCD